MKNKKLAVLKSFLAMLLCVAMLIGNTFAWFTDGVRSGENVIVSGNLDLEMYWTDDPESGVWYDVEDALYNTIFSYDNWEPGYTEVRYIKLVNSGSLALNYSLALTPQTEVGKLAEVVNVYFANSQVAMNSRQDLAQLQAIGLLNNVMNGGATATGTLLPAGQVGLHPAGEVVMTFAMSMVTTAGNEYQGEKTGDFTITALATQCAHESDSFGADYDGTSDYPGNYTGGTISMNIAAVDNKIPTGGVTMAGSGISAFVPEGAAVEAGTDKLTLTVTPLSDSSSNITVVNEEVLIPVDVHIQGIAPDNTKPIVIDMGAVLPKYLNMGNYHLYHVENGTNAEMTLVSSRDELTAHNTFTYDPYTGNVTVAMASFSEVALVADTAAPWSGSANYDWYNEEAIANKTFEIINADQLYAFAKIVGGMAEDREADSFEGATVKLISDINLNGGKVKDENDKTKIFYPIGYYNNTDEKVYDREDAEVVGMAGVDSSVSAFEGTFDGNGHTISDFYQNTWEMFGDYNNGYTGTPNYYKDAMGLFGYVFNGTVKNLTVNNFESDGEFTPTGVIAAYAAGNSTFENIAITNCNPRVYNTGNGGIIGVAGRENDAVESITLRNITVDKTNKISALWGSYDVACGGLVGMYRGNATATGAATGDTISFENCHVAAQMDVYNDVCGNYQYYAYRYAGMIIGSVRHNIKNEEGKTIPNMAGISASGCTVNFGTWNDYYYCEFEKNSQASYTEDFQFSRVDKSEILFDAAGNVTGCTHNHSEAEDKTAVYLPFHQLFTGYSWGVSSIGLKEYSGIVTDLDIIEGDQNESVEKFETKFTGDFLYRVGNSGTVSLGTLFAEKELLDSKGNPITVNDSGVWVTVEKFNADMAVSGTFTKSTTGNWENGKIQFSGTGLVKLTIQDYDFCTPTVLILEVVSARNYESVAISSLGSGNVVLLCDTKLNNNGSLALQNATLYGNGFEIDVSAGKVTGESVTANYLLYMNNGILDNVQVKGAVYTNFDVISSNSYNNPTVLSVGNSRIVNSVISNCASPVRVRSGNIEIVNSTLRGGYFANLDIRGGKIILDNVTTVNQVNLNDQASNGKAPAGLGIVFFYEGPSSDTKLEIRNTLTQHNYISNAQTDNSYANMLTQEVFGNEKYSSLWYVESESVKWANTGILSLSEVVGKDNIIVTSQSNQDKYTEMNVSYKIPGELIASNGYLYTTTPQEPADSYESSSAEQYEVIPHVSFDHLVNEMIKGEDSESSCISDPQTNSESITFAEGDSFTWKVNILKCANKEIDYTVWIDGTQYTDSITFTESGTHTVVFKYSDPNNYRKVVTGEEVQYIKYTVEYETSMQLVVSEMAAQAKNAEITFPLLESYGTTKVTVDGKTYIMPNLAGTNIPKYGEDLTFDTSNRKYGSLKADGKTNVDVYYPIIKTAISGNYMVFPVFGNGNGTLVQIIDFADNGSGAATTYNASTQELPSGLSVSRGYTVQWATDKDVVGSGSMNYGSWTNGLLAFKYQSSSDTIALKVMSNYLSYYPDINLRTNDRNEQVMVAEYKYVDNKGDTIYYCVGYHIEERNSGYAFGETVPESTCVTPDTLITLADGQQVRVDQLKGDELLLTWNLETGKYEAAPIVFVDSEEETEYEIIHLYFSDGSDVKVISEHGFFDLDLGKYVYIDANNYADFVGHRFVALGDERADRWDVVTLDQVIIEKEVTTAWSPVTFRNLCYYTNGVLSMPGGIEGLFNIFEVNTATMRYDQKQKQADIEQFGLFTIDDFGGMITQEAFDAFNGAYLKVALAKGLLTWEDIAEMAERYIPLM